jgi:hypothetical protein
VRTITADETDILTEYELYNVTVFQSRPFTSSRPGVPPRLTVTQLGGTVTLNATPFIQVEDGLPALRPGSETVLLLRRNDDGYVIAGTFYGAFAPEYRDKPVDQALARLIAEARDVGR